MEGKNRRHGSRFPVGVSIPPAALQRPSGCGLRERSARNANSGLSAKAEASATDNLGPGVLDHSPESVVRLATSSDLRLIDVQADTVVRWQRAVPEILAPAPSRSAIEVAPAPPQNSAA